MKYKTMGDDDSS